MKLFFALAILVQSLSANSYASDNEKIFEGMECAVAKYELSGAHVFSGDPMTTVKGPWYTFDMKFEGYTEASKDPLVATFPKGVGLIGRTWISKDGFEFSPDVQKLPADKFLRLEAAKKFGIHGTLAVFFKQYESVIEFYTDEIKTEWDVEGVRACFL